MLPMYPDREMPVRVRLVVQAKVDASSGASKMCAKSASQTVANAS
jgi:hypothetical protein